MVSLIIEDGSIVPNANSYVTVDEIIDYAEARGVTLDGSSPLVEDKITIMAINAMDYLESLSLKYKGEQVFPDTQSLAFPRKHVFIGNRVLPMDSIPREMKRAQCQLCIYISSGITLLPVNNSEAFVTREKIGPIETEYSEAVKLALGSQPNMPLVDSILEPLLRPDAFALTSVRV